MVEDTWVCCDSCSKWRRIPQVLADSLDEHIPWQVMLLKYSLKQPSCPKNDEDITLDFYSSYLCSCRHCHDNPDPTYNQCDIPQELTDIEIDQHTKLLVSTTINPTAAFEHNIDIIARFPVQLSKNILKTVTSPRLAL